MWRQIQRKGEIWLKVMNIYKQLAKRWSYCTETVLNSLSDAFCSLAICAFILEILIFFVTSVSINLSLFLKVHFQNFCNDTAMLLACLPACFSVSKTLQVHQPHTKIYIDGNGMFIICHRWSRHSIKTWIKFTVTEVTTAMFSGNSFSGNLQTKTWKIA